jgi:tetratricopeptide (TPR) repeat protein
MELQTSVFQSTSAIEAAENVLPLCELAKGFEEAGEFERARETLNPFWKNVGERPETVGFDDVSRAELLLRSGALTGWLGSANQIPGAQEIAKDLISESATIFETLGLSEKVAEARVDIAICYWREGALDEARVTLRHVLDSLADSQSEQRLRALLNSAIIEKVATRDLEALRIYREAAPLFDLSSNHALKGKFHNSHATLLKSLALSEGREEYIDKALVEFTAASIHFEQAGHRRFQARVENNVGFLFASLGRFTEAQEHLDRARSLHQSAGDRGGVAGADDTRAQAFLLEGKYAEAEKAANAAVRSFKRGGEQTLLAEALTTHGKALAGLNQYHVAKSCLDQAVAIAHSAGDPDRGGIAAVTAIEELPDLPADAMQEYYRKAESLLANSQNRSIKTRLGECARRVLAAEFARTEQELATDHSQGESFVPVEAGVSLEAEVLRYEGSLIRRALESCGGSVTRAARLLGVTHQGLAFILNGRHSDLLSIRTPVKHRRRSIIRYH